MPIKSAHNIKISDPDTGKQIVISIPEPLANDVAYTLSTAGGTLGGGGGGSGATTELDNLTVTAINTDLIFDDNAHDVKTPNATGGSSSKNMFLKSGDVVDGEGGQVGVRGGESTGTGDAGAALVQGGAAGATSASAGRTDILGGDVTAGALTAGAVNITGGANDGTGDGGDTNISAGTANGGGANGKIRLFDGVAASVIGKVWSATDTNGGGQWETPTSGGASQALDNLAAVQINTSLNFSSPQDIGSGGGDYVANLFLAAVKDADTGLSANFGTRILYDSVAFQQSLNWADRQVYDIDTNLSINWTTRDFSDGTALAGNWGNRVLLDSSGLQSVDWTGRELSDSTEVPSIQYEDRYLADSTGTSILDYSGPTIVFPNTVTPALTTGNQTIDKMSGTVNFAATDVTLTVTNSTVTVDSLVFCTVRTDDSTAVIKNVVPSNGSFIIKLTAAATAETSVGFLVINQ